MHQSKEKDRPIENLNINLFFSNQQACMMQKINFSPGPSQLYFTVNDHIRSALREGIPSLSHRSEAYVAIHKHTTQCLRELLSIPDDFHILFLASATEVWERIIQNGVERYSFHIVNGAFSQKFYETSLQLGRKAIAHHMEEGTGLTGPVSVPETELIALTHNETSTGVTIDTPVINQFREQNPEALITIDAVSSIPYASFDYSKFDSVFFSVQKGFGLPAGLGVWIVNNRMVAKADQLRAKGNSIGSYHSLPSLISFSQKNQTPETPNVLGIYLLGRVAEDMIRRGIETIRRETEYKAALLYHTFDNHPFIQSFVKKQEVRSKTVLVADTGKNTNAIKQLLIKKQLHPGDGYGPFKDTHLRFANFPTHSKEQMELLVDTLATFQVGN